MSCHSPQPSAGIPATELDEAQTLGSGSHGGLVALVGQPNSGKTTLFNALTGARFKTANYPGATVEYSVGELRREEGSIKVLDSPGLSSLNAHSPDESVTVEALFAHPSLGTPDLAVVVVDANQLARHLYLAQQIVDSGFKTVLAVTMLDLLDRKGLVLDQGQLARDMGCPVTGVDARTGAGVRELVELVVEALAQPAPKPAHGIAAPAPRPPLGATAVEESYRRVEAMEAAAIRPSDCDEQAIARPDPDTVRLDRFFLHHIWGLAFFVASMFGIFTLIFWAARPAMDLIDEAFGWAAGSAHSLLGNSWYSSMLADGLITGFGTVVTFLPQILILFFAMGFLEDSGYLARGAMLVDRPLSKIGLNGRSFVPMLSGFACAIPGILATRTIPSRRERILTIFIMPLMTCSARLPVYGLLLSFLTPRSRPWIGGLGLSLLYLTSLVVGSVMATIASRAWKGRNPSPFILELPTYRRPQLGVVLRSTYSRAMNYLKKASVPITVVATLLWALTYFPVTPGLAPAEHISHSYAAAVGHWLDAIVSPLGFDWRVGVALIAAFAAREVFVGSLALVLKVTAGGAAVQGALLEAMRTATRADGQLMFTTASVIGLVVFFIFAMQCFTTLVVARKESGSRLMPVLQVAVFTGLAYLLAFGVSSGIRLLGVP